MSYLQDGIQNLLKRNTSSAKVFSELFLLAREENIMTKAKTKTPSLYYPQEQIIISVWLEGSYDISELEFDNDNVEGVGLESSNSIHKKSIHFEDRALANAVARIVLSAIESRLPQWAAFDHTGTVIHGRKQVGKAPHKQRQLSTIPRKLFTINWAQSGPGYSWPDSYHITWLPIYDVWVITLSQDSTDVYGYADLAIDWLDKDADIIEGARNIITMGWREQFLGYDQNHWESVLDSDLVDEATAYKWADSV
jgi:hypothetical protein